MYNIHYMKHSSTSLVYKKDISHLAVISYVILQNLFEISSVFRLEAFQNLFLITLNQNKSLYDEDSWPIWSRFFFRSDSFTILYTWMSWIADQLAWWMIKTPLIREHYHQEWLTCSNQLLASRKKLSYLLGYKDIFKIIDFTYINNRQMGSLF